MRRNPIYVFKDLDALGIANVPLESTIQINDADDLTPGSQPLMIQLTAKDGITSGSTIRDFLGNPNNYANASDTTEVHSELEKMEIGGKQGWRLLGVPNGEYGPIGSKAIDLSLTGGNTGFAYGAMGDNSFAAGYNVQAQGRYSTALGNGTYARVDSGIALGKYNVSQDINNILEVGVGMSESDRKNALNITMDGVLVAPLATNFMIEAKGDQALTTKKYVQAGDDLKVNKIGDIMTGDLAIHEANLVLRKNQSGYNGDISVEGSVKIGTSFTGNSTIAFNATGTGVGGQKFYYDNVESEFKVDTANSEGYRVWHWGNQGADSGMDADKLDGMQPLELPVSTRTHQALDLKYDKVGGTITGDVDIVGNLNVQLETTLVGDLRLNNIASAATFKEEVQFDRSAIVTGIVQAQSLKLKTDPGGKSGTFYTDLDNPTIFPAIYWDNNDKQFEIDTLAGTGYTVWHSGNFDPDSKLDIIGGTITGNLGINGTLITNGIAEFNSLVDAKSDLSVAGISTFMGAGTFNSSVDINSSLNVHGTGRFEDVVSMDNNLFVTGIGTFGSSISVAGASTFEGMSTFADNVLLEKSQHVQLDTLVEGSSEIYGELMVGGSVITGTDSNSNSTVGFTDTTTTNTPTFYWDNANRDFYVDLDSNTPQGGFNIWHMGNFDPTDPTVIPKNFDDLNDTPGAKIADKYIQVSSDGLRLAYVDVPDIAAVWGNITGTLSNQSDVNTAINAKYDKTGGDITGNVRVTGSTTLDGITTVGSNFITMADTTLQGATTINNTLGVTGATTINNTLDIDGITTAKSTLTVIGNATFASDALIEQDLSVTGNTTLTGLVSTTGSLNVAQNLNVGLSSILTGAVTMGNSLDVTGVSSFASTVGIVGDTSIDGTLTVLGAGTFSSGVSLYGAAGLSVAGSSTFASDLTVGLDLSVSQNLNVTGNVSLPGADSDLTVGGDTTIVGVLRAQGLSYFTGASIFDNTVLISGRATTNGLTVVASDADIQTNLNVDGHTDTSSLTVTGTTILNDIQGTQLDISGTSDLDGTVSTLADVNVGTTLDVGTTVSTGGTITSGGDLVATTGSITAGANLSVTGTSTLTGAVLTNDTLSVTTNFTVGGTSILTGAVAADGGLSTTTLDATSGAIISGGDLIVSIGSTSVNDLSVATTLDVIGETTLSGLTASTLNIVGDSVLGGNLTVDGNTTTFNNDTVIVNSILDVTDISTFKDMHISGDVSIIGAHSLKIDTFGVQEQVATLDNATGKVRTDQLPALAITEVHVVADIAARDALTVETGDVAKVLDSGAGEPQTYIYDGTIWIDIQETSDVITVNGQRGTVVLDTSHIAENTNLYYTEARVDLNIAGKTTDDLTEGIGNLYYPQADKTTVSFITATQAIDLDGIEANATADQTGAEIKIAYEAELDTNAYDDAAVTKLADIEANATADQTGAEIKIAYEAEADTNAYNDAAVTKLDGIEANATADQTGAEIKIAYEAEADTNAYDDAAVTKLADIEANATADQTGAEIKIAYEAELDTNAYDDAAVLKVLTVNQNGDTASRPIANIGEMYFDTDLGIPIWYNGTDWVNSAGSIV